MAQKICLCESAVCCSVAVFNWRCILGFLPRWGAEVCVRCFVCSPLVATGALFPALGCEPDVPEEAEAPGERGEWRLWPVWEDAEGRRRDALFSVPCKHVWHLLTVAPVLQQELYNDKHHKCFVEPTSFFSSQLGSNVELIPFIIMFSLNYKLLCVTS